MNITSEQSAFWSKWISELRSGNYNQTQETLQDAAGYCCLGVACDISGSGHWEEYLYVVGDEETEDEHGWSLEPSDRYFKDWFGFNEPVADPRPARADACSEQPVEYPTQPFSVKCMELNDDAGWTFEQIADWVEDLAKANGFI